MTPIPVILFAYARPTVLAQVLLCLRLNEVRLIIAYSDGAKGERDAADVTEVRRLLREVTWAETRVTERAENFGLGRNVLAGVTEVAAQHEAFIVWEDDLLAVPGTYAWLCSALRNYAADERVMSVTAWTHPTVAPTEDSEEPYFDARAECWVWGAWRRSWRGMRDENALAKLAAARARGAAPDAYGSDLPAMAEAEARKNIWAVRWLYHHLANGGLCLRPPWSMVEHIGFETLATHASAAQGLLNPALREAPPIPAVWPQPAENPGVRMRWSHAYPRRGWLARSGERAHARWQSRGGAKALVRSLLPRGMVRWIERRFFRVRWTSGFSTWAEARQASSGYDSARIFEKVLEASRAVRDGLAAYERDGVTFATPSLDAPLFTALADASAAVRPPLTVIDFGGALGSTYWRHRPWLPALGEVRWWVVDQPFFVAIGRDEFADGPLAFFDSIDSCSAAGKADVLLLSSVLPYLENPHAFLREATARPFQFVVIDHTRLIPGDADQLTVQHVPANICRSSYPCWLLSEARLREHFATRFVLRAEWSRPDEIGLPLRGFLFERRQEHSTEAKKTS